MMSLVVSLWKNEGVGKRKKEKCVFKAMADAIIGPGGLRAPLFSPSFTNADTV